MSRDRASFALLLCTGLLLSLAGPRPASLQRVPPSLAGASLRSAVAGPSLGAVLGGPRPPPHAGPHAAPVGGFRAALAGGLRAVPAGGFRWPLGGSPQVVRRFDPPPQPWLSGHRGVDLAGVPGATVHAAGPGRVHFAGRIAGRPVVSVDHAGGLRTTYEPVEPIVRVGDEVAAGDPIGLLVSGHPGCAVAACLHWGLRRGEVYLDPLSLLGLGQVRLLPLA